MAIQSLKQQGYILIIGIVVMAILMTMSAAVWGYTSLQVKSSRQAVQKSQAIHIAEAGIDKAIESLNSDSSFNGEASVDLAEGSYTTTVSNVDPNNKQITSTAYIPNAANPTEEVTIKVNVTLDLSSVAFNFGVQVGAGGLTMNNNSQVNGSVYSNGNISGGSAIITGDATVAGGGSAAADQECTTNNSDFAFNLTDRRDVAQKFTPSVSGPLTRVSVYLRKTGSPSNITVRILSNNSNVPSKTQVGGNGTISSSTVTTSYGWIDATFSSTPNLVAGTAYWLVLDTSSSSSNYYTWARDTSDASCSGTGTYSTSWNATNPNWAQTASDFNIRTYMGGVATYLQGVTVNGNARANSLQSCNIGGNAYYATTNTCTVGGTSNSGTSDSPQQALPISQAQIDEWKSVAESGGTIAGPYTVSGVVTMGPQKIDGDLTLDLNSTLYITGPIWVEGDITISNNAAVRVDNSLGNAGTVLFADDPDDQAAEGYINISNNSIIAGNNNPNSYLMILTTKSGSAMSISNNAAGAIYYASNGTINVSNNAGGSQITGYGINLSNNATVTYTIGLQNTTFANGPGGAWAIVPGTYIILN